MDKTVSIVVAILLVLVSVLALGWPVSIVRFMHGWLRLWAWLFSSNVLTHEQSSRVELARRDSAGYIRSHYGQITIIRVIGLIAILVAAALLCMAFT